MNDFNAEHTDTNLDMGLNVEFRGPNPQTHNVPVRILTRASWILRFNDRIQIMVGEG